MTSALDQRLSIYRKTVDSLIREVAVRDERVACLSDELAELKTEIRKGIIAPPVPVPMQPTRTTNENKGRAAVVCWDLGHNPAGRAVVIYDLLAKAWNVDLIGPLWKRFGGQVWSPIAQSGRRIIGFPCTDLEDFYPQAMSFASGEHYDLVVVVKPRLPGLLLGAMIQKASECPIVLDIDDFELSFFKDETAAQLEELEAAGPAPMIQPFEELATRACEGIIRHFPARIVSNVALRNRYGGHIVRHARDEAAFHPDRFDKTAARADMGISDADFAIVFVGTPRPHKGIYDVARALHELEDKRFVFHIVGAIGDKSIKAKLDSFTGARIEYHPGCDMHELPMKIAAADAVVLLQDAEHPISQFQIPAKVSDATAFGLPVLATDVPPLRDLFPLGLLRRSSAEQLKSDLEDLLAARDEGRSEADRQAVRATFLGELGTEVNALRLEFAISEASKSPFLPEGMERLLAHTHASYTTLRRQAMVPTESPTKPKRSRQKSTRPDIVMFWKQNDSGLYGRRSDMLMKYLQRSGKVGRILQFDAPQPVETLHRLVLQAGGGSSRAEKLVLRNLIDDQFRLRDSATKFHRSYLWSARGDRHALLPDIGPSQGGVVDYVAQQMELCGISPENAIAWVCPVVFDFPAIAKAIPFKAIVGDLIDDQRTFEMKESYRQRITKSYEETLPLFDTVLTNCEPMREAFAALRQDIHVIPNGAELPEDPDAVPTLPEIDAYPRPIIGYVGNLRDRFDWPLLAETARLMPDASFVIVGGGAREEDVAIVAGIPNIHLHGPVPYEKVQSCIRSFDVAIMPHVYSDQTRRMNPLKIYNYVALHRPVVTTAVDNIDEGLAPYLRFSNSADGFSSAIDAALEDPMTNRDGYAKAVKTVSWEDRVFCVLSTLDRTSSEKIEKSNIC